MRRVPAGAHILAPSDLKDADPYGLIPSEVFTALAILVRSRWNGKHSTFTEDELFDRLDKYDFRADTIRNNNWIEGVCAAYREAGWIVLRETCPDGPFKGLQFKKSRV
jgi:hypothetical protein